MQIAGDILLFSQFNWDKVPFRAGLKADNSVDGIIMPLEVPPCPYPRCRVTVDDHCQARNSSGTTLTAVTTVTIETKLFFPEIQNDIQSTDDFECIRNCVLKLENSGFYYGRLSLNAAATLLKHTPVGTYLVRDSSDPAYLFALSLQTLRGPTSIRIHYSNGKFRFDSEDQIAGHEPSFDCVLKLLEYYVHESSSKSSSSTTGYRHIFLDGSGRRDQDIILKKPLYNQVRSLQHMCRTVINTNPQLQRVQLPKTMQTFLNEYPYTR